MSDAWEIQRRSQMSLAIRTWGSHCVPHHPHHMLCEMERVFSREARDNAQSERHDVKRNGSRATALHVLVRIDASAARTHGCGTLCAQFNDTQWGCLGDARGEARSERHHDERVCNAGGIRPLVACNALCIQRPCKRLQRVVHTSVQSAEMCSGPEPPFKCENT